MGHALKTNFEDGLYSWQLGTLSASLLYKNFLSLLNLIPLLNLKYKLYVPGPGVVNPGYGVVSGRFSKIKGLRPSLPRIFLISYLPGQGTSLIEYFNLGFLLKLIKSTKF